MISLPCGVCRAVPVLARRCVSGRPRGPAPPVVFEVVAGVLTVSVRTDDAVLAYTAPTGCGDARLVVPMAALAAVAGHRDAPAELSVGPGLAGTVRWPEHGAPKTHAFDALLPGKQHCQPDPPSTWHAVPGEFLAAVHACGKTTARDAGRYALTRVQVRGRAGQVVATDGRTALVRGGFTLPFADDVLVAAVPVFAARELTSEPEVRVGRTATHLVVGAGPWRVFLPIDAAGRFPDVAGVVPRSAPTEVVVDDRDAAEVLAQLHDLPGGDAECRPVTLAVAGGGFVVRAGDAATGTVRSVRLGRSTATGPGVQLALDRRALARALALGCRTVALAPDKPVVFTGPGTTFLVAPLTIEPEPFTATDPNPTTAPERSPVVKHETNGHPPNGRADPPDPTDPLAAAEDLRAAVSDALTAAVRLVAALKHQRKEKKALTQVWSSLKALNLGPGGAP